MRLERVQHIHSGEPPHIIGADRHHRVAPNDELIVGSLIFGELLGACLSAHLPRVAEDSKRLRARRSCLVQLHLEVLDLRAWIFLVVVEQQLSGGDVPLQRWPPFFEILEDVPGRSRRRYEVDHTPFLQSLEDEPNGERGATELAGDERAQMSALRQCNRVVKWPRRRARIRQRRAQGLMLHEGEQIRAAKSALPPVTDTKTLQYSCIRPPAERCLADVEKRGSFTDVEKIVHVGQSCQNLRSCVPSALPVAVCL